MGSRVIEDSHRLRLAWSDKGRPAGRALGALVSRLVSAAAAGGFDNGQCLPALSDLMPFERRLVWIESSVVYHAPYRQIGSAY